MFTACCLVASISAGCWDNGHSEDWLPKEAYWQSGSACGPNALYVMLRIFNKDVDYDELLRFLSPPPEGNSLAELHDAGTRWGLSTQVFRVNPKELGAFRTPFIAHLENQGLSHMVLVVKSDDSHVCYWNAEDSHVDRVEAHRFRRLWTGYALTIGTRGFDRMTTLVMTLEAGVLGFVVVRKITRWRTRDGKNC